MTTLEELGLLKMDCLGLRTLTVIQDAEKLASKSAGKEIDVEKIDYDDKEVLASIGTGKTDGVFQLESSGMKKMCIRDRFRMVRSAVSTSCASRIGAMTFRIGSLGKITLPSGMA